MSSRKFGKDYFQDGIKKRVSLYSNFRWMPSVSFAIASRIKSLYPDQSILDYGCAMGYTVYALRLLDVEAYGYDSSPYAIRKTKKEIREYVFAKASQCPRVDVVFGKDVLEHIAHPKIMGELEWLSTMCRKACFVVPLGENGEYRITEYQFDKTHIIIEDEEWWAKTITDSGFRILGFQHDVTGFKDKWFLRNPIGNGTFFLKGKML